MCWGPKGHLHIWNNVVLPTGTWAQWREKRGLRKYTHTQSRSEHKSPTGPLHESVTVFSSSQLSTIRRKRNNALEQVANLLNAYGSCNAWSDVKAFMLEEWCLIVVVYHHFHTCYCRQEWDVILLLCFQDKGKSWKPKKREAYNNLFWAKIGTPLCLEFSALIKLLSQLTEEPFFFLRDLVSGQVVTAPAYSKTVIIFCLKTKIIFCLL